MTLCFQGNLNEIWFEIIILLVSLWQHKINTIQGILKHYVCISINGEVFNLTQVFPYDKCFHMMMIPSLTLFCGVKILICFHKIIKIRLLPEITAKESKKKICSIQISKLQFSFWGLCFKPIKRTSSEGTGHNTLSGWNQLYFDISLHWVVFKETGAFFQLVFYEQLFCSIFAN